LEIRKLSATFDLPRRCLEFSVAIIIPIHKLAQITEIQK
jgi:hypothetical protein